MMERRVRTRIGIVAVSAGAFVAVAIFHASDGGVATTEGLVGEAAIYGVPFAVFVFAIWSAGSRWRAEGEGPSSLRKRISAAAEVLAVLSSTLYLLTLPFAGLIAEHERLGAAWVFSGVIAAVLGAVCSIFASPRLWSFAISCALLVPCWVLAAGLFAKMMMD